MQVEVAICTWNRASLLKQTLSRLQHIFVPDGVDFSVIVIDNNSTDDTQTIIKCQAETLTIQAAVEPRQGHVFARNRAIEMASGELLLWIDDDVIVDKNWLAAYVEAAANSDADFWGGPIEPRFLAGQPNWIQENWDVLKGCYAERKLGPEAFDFDSETLPYGANFAIRTEAQKKFRFAESLGRKGSSVVGDDEVQLLRRLIAAGIRGRWVPKASVEHCIDPGRATLEFVRRYFVGQGSRIQSENGGWGWSQRRLWWHWKTRRILFRLTRLYASSPTYVAHVIRAALAEGQYRAKLSSF